MRSLKLTTAILLALGVLLPSGAPVHAQTARGASATAAQHPDLSGIWEHSATSKGRRDPVPWTDEARAIMKDDVDNHWINHTSDENAYCLPAGMPFMMSGAEGFSIVQSPKLITVNNEERPSPRFFYVGGKHPSLEDFDVTSVGHSIAHWEGEELVVDTIGMRAGPTVQWVRSEKSHLVERYRLLPSDKLQITFTWDDPKLLTKPFTYTYVMDRAPPERYVLEYWCDPRDPERGRGGAFPEGGAPAKKAD